MTMTIRKSVFLKADSATVWDHLTKADLLAKWFHPAEEDLTEGQPYTLKSSKDGDRMCWGTVESATPQEHMRWSFTVGPLQGQMTTVEWKLEPAPGGTRLTLEHSGLPEGGEGYGLVLALDEGWHGFIGNLHKISNDYVATIHVPASAKAAKAAIMGQMTDWWSTRVEQNDKGFTVRFNRSHVTFETHEADGQLVWDCTDANMLIDGVADSGEWTGTQLLWDIAADGDGSRITMTHAGLTRSLACHDVCTRGWQHFFENSLKSHLSGGTGSPETSEALSAETA